MVLNSGKKSCIVLIKPWEKIINILSYKCKQFQELQLWMVDSKSTYEWHTDDIPVQTSDIRMAYKYKRVTYG